MNNFVFGQGDLFTIPNSKNPTPIKIGTPQSLDLSFSGDVAELFGNKTFAVASAKTTSKVTGTITMGEHDPSFVSRYLFGAEKSTGYYKQVENLVSLTETTEKVEYVADSFNRDLGVISEAGLSFIRVDSTAEPKSFEYKLDEATGTYSFNTAQKDTKVFIRFDQHIENEGTSYIIKNIPMGSTPSFRLETIGKFNGQAYGIILNNCTATSYNISTTNDGFALPTFEFSASVDKNGVLGTMESFSYDIV